MPERSATTNPWVPGRHAVRAPATALALACLALPSAPAPASAQDAPPRAFSVSVSIGYEGFGPAPGLVDSFNDAGFGDEGAGGCFFDACFEGIDFPYTSREDRPEWAVEVRYRFHPLWSSAVVGGRAAAGRVEGMNAALGTSAVGYRSVWAGLVASHHMGPLRVGAGPAVERTDWAVASVDPWIDPGRDEWTGTRVGLVAEAAVSVARWGPVGLLVVGRFRDTNVTRVVDVHDNTLTTRNRTFFFGLGAAL